MKELSLNILDITQNSISACASKIIITVEKDTENNLLTVRIEDNGKGMDKEFVKSVTDPFTTTRSTRKVGMGIPLLKMSAEQAEGEFILNSELGVGTEVAAIFKLNHIDRVPLGDIGQTISALVSCNQQVDFLYVHKSDGQEFRFDTMEIKEILGEVPLNEPDVIIWMQEYIRDGIKSINGGA